MPQFIVDARNVAERAAQWGSYMPANDPGACMYGFNHTGLLQNEAHRAACLAFIAGPCREAAGCNDDPAADNAELDALRDYIKSAPIQPEESRK